MPARTASSKHSSKRTNQNTNSKKQPKIQKTINKHKGSNRKTSSSLNENKFFIIGLGIFVFVIVAIIIGSRKPADYLEEYDLKGLTVAAACEKARGVGWKVDTVREINYNGKTDCYNTNLIVTDYSYSSYDKEVDIYYGEKITEEQKKQEEKQKKLECEAEGKWYRDNQCKTQEEWENQYAWKDAHAACKRYGSSGYAKTLTDCYVGNDYKGPVNNESENAASSTSSSSSTSDLSSGYQSIFDTYSARLQNECPNLSISGCAELVNEGVEKMAEYMWKASGTDGQYETYSNWASKLYDVYMDSVK